jgi:hypothetical protein
LPEAELSNLLAMPILPATHAATVQALSRVQDEMLKLPQAEIPTEHVIHGGMYARTVRLPQDAVISGALIKVPTMLTVNGHAMVFVGDGWTELYGYNVFPASAGRKQLFVALGPVEITMVFPTKATTVDEAEREFTDEFELLQTRRDIAQTVNITGE